MAGTEGEVGHLASQFKAVSRKSFGTANHFLIDLCILLIKGLCNSVRTLQLLQS